MRPLRDEIKRVLPEAIAMRRYLHRYPELSGCEENTKRYIKEKLANNDLSFEHLIIKE